MGFLFVKTVVISTGIVSMAMGLKLTVPLLTEAVPSISTFFFTCLTPPYLYLLLNFIILSIFATSKLTHHHNHSPPDSPPETLLYHAPEPLKISQNDYSGIVSEEFLYEPPKTNETVTNDENLPLKTTVTVSEEAVGMQKKDSSDLDLAFSDENQKPPVSARFSHRKAAKASPEGGKMVALGVAKPKRQDTLESTWRTITEGRPMPLTRHLKKSDTWEQARRSATPLTDLNGGEGGKTPPPPKMKKAETFGGRENNVSPAGGSSSAGRLRKEPSLSQDELNRRVEAFIHKFNEEMRLQRQESLRQYRAMVNGGVH
ncbi:uncharacterized protein LOC130945026 [Arachis stenosperma]|uniref:uncharacterized protein LOC130945026 n=1 Tax=Arachis stenosperma TaxID=217475 RepID=UPI0025AD29AB|nr:uncharacterized protein LOC130945026 [Arachis stenosperma]